MTRQLVYCLVGFTFSLLMSNTHVMAAESIDVAYKKVGDELVAMRKKYQDTQPVVYLILDQVDKIYNVAKELTDERSELHKQVAIKEVEIKEMLKAKEMENISLQNETIALKSVLDAMQHKLEVSTKNLELEKKYSNKLRYDVAKLLQDKTALQQSKEENSETDKLQQYLQETQPLKKRSKPAAKKKAARYKAVVQNLNLSSTSEPSSPR